MKTHLSSHDTMASARVIRPTCPQCNDLLFASTLSVHVNERDIRHWWSCDNCGHEFMTVAKMPNLQRHAVRA